MLFNPSVILLKKYFMMINIVQIVPIMLLNSLFHIDIHTYIHMAKKVIDYLNY
jgi:hypothetical protein